jgi:hypothetical protein
MIRSVKWVLIFLAISIPADLCLFFVAKPIGDSSQQALWFILMVTYIQGSAATLARLILESHPQTRDMKS